ncbi:response regulator [Macrococcus carouselicus]|uniref:Response regulator n=1 Tax=Macrococcus carouselicus TaxID=69969 RepID=A0A9Q8FK14_9STAP|nr:response regulator [Macrococcus carouselicus]TDL95418.1 response regulator [Macrococcus carouselicus]
MRILVIDDEANIRLLLTEIFSLNGHTVEEAENGLIALKMVKRVHYDLIMMDKRMPVMNGEETLVEMKKCTDTPVYVISAFQSADEVERLYQLGASGVLTKPFGMREVLQIAEKLQ